MAGWRYLKKDGSELDGFTSQKLIQLADEGVLDHDTLVCHDEKTRGKWVSIAKLRNRLKANSQDSSPSRLASETKDASAKSDSSRRSKTSNTEERSVSFRHRAVGGMLGFTIGMLAAGITRKVLMSAENIEVTAQMTVLLYSAVPILVVIGAIIGVVSTYSVKRNEKGNLAFQKQIKIIGLAISKRSTPLSSNSRLVIEFNKAQEMASAAAQAFSPAASVVQDSIKQRHIVVQLRTGKKQKPFHVLRGTYNERESRFFYTSGLLNSADKVVSKISEELQIPVQDRRD